MTAQDRPQAVRHTVLFKTGSVIMEVFFLKKNMTLSITEHLLGSQS